MRAAGTPGARPGRAGSVGARAARRGRLPPPPERGRRGGGSAGSPLLPPPPSPPPPGFASAIAPLRSPPAPPSTAPGCMVHGARAPLRRSSGRSRVLSAAAAERWVKDPPGPPAAAARPSEGGPGPLLALGDPPPRARGRRAGCPRAAGGEPAGWSGDRARPRPGGAPEAWRVRGERSPAGPRGFLRPHVADPGPAGPSSRGARLETAERG